MTRKEKILDLIRGLTLDASDVFKGVSANEIAQLTGYDRTNVSRDLNTLVEENKLKKTLGRPVKFYFNEVCTEVNPENFVGASGSLKPAIELARTSLLYPQKLNILITGATGVGKTTFAEYVFADAKIRNLIHNTSPFLSFNCSEYADNPQLLLSHLFGHKKGSFTGADADKSGLVEEADGGVLLLDEIHRLGAEGQEMLFQLIDKGRYRRLGETGQLRTANVILVGATTEDVGSFLLQTFLRRFPVIIRLPSLSERPLIERLELILRAFYHESSRISLPIFIDASVIRDLLLYTCPGNIGQLSADIKLTCAQSFCKHIEHGSDMRIGRADLPARVKSLPAITQEESEIINRLLNGGAVFQVNPSDEKSIQKFLGELSCHEKLAFPDNSNSNIDIPVCTACIVATCMTGEGSAVKIASYIEKNIPCINEAGIKIVSVNISNVYNIDFPDKFDIPVLAVVGTVDPSFTGVPFIPIEELVFGDGIQELNAIIKMKMESPMNDADVEKQKTYELLKEATLFIDVDKVISVGTEAFDALQLTLSSKRRRSILIRFLLHLACMLERILQKLPLEYQPIAEDCESSAIIHYDKLRGITSIVELAFCVEIPDSEIRFLEDLLFQYL